MFWSGNKEMPKPISIPNKKTQAAAAKKAAKAAAPVATNSEQKSKRIESMNRKVNLFLMLAAFANTLLISLFIGAGFIAQQLTLVDNPGDVSNSFGLILYMIVAAAVMLAILKFYKGKSLFRLFEYGLIASSASVFGMTFLPGYELYVIIAAVAARMFVPNSQTVLLLSSCIIVGALMGSSLDFVPVAVFALLLSAYDYIAVFKTKHMVTLAKGLGEREAAFSIKVGVKYVPKKEEEKPAFQKAGTRTGVELGLGDFLIGIMLAVSALKIGTFPSFGYALASVLGATAGLGLMFYFLEKKGGYFPAVPPIAAGSFICIAAFWLTSALFGWA
jgi:presenilin-like A22 family membrane protease